MIAGSCSPGATQGLISYWNFDQNGAAVLDQIGGKNGTWNGTTNNHYSSSFSPNFNTAGNFSGSNDGTNNGDYVSLGNSWPVIMQPNLTVAAWIYPTKNGSYPLIIIGGQQYYGSSQFMLSYMNNAVSWVVNSADGNGSHAYSTQASASLNNWHLVVATLNGSSAKLYIDNNSPVTQTTPSGFQFNNNPTEFFVMGRTNSSNYAAHYRGKIDEVRIYNTALDSNAVSSLYGNGLGCI